MEARSSTIGGDGLFAREPIAEGEVVVIWGGELFTEAQVQAGEARPGSIAAVDEGIYLAGRAGTPPQPEDLLNHSCAPNVWMADEVTLVARRFIETDHELTADYAMWEASEDWTTPWACHCGAANCRRQVTGRDWRLETLQSAYEGHFSPFIHRRIELLKAGVESPGAAGW